MQTTRKHREGGFTLVELTTSIGVSAIVLMVMASLLVADEPSDTREELARAQRAAGGGAAPQIEALAERIEALAEGLEKAG